MKIGMVIDDTIDSNDGVQQYVRTLGAWLKLRGHQVHYLAGQSKPADGVFSLAKNIRIKFNGNTLSMPLLASSQKIKALLEHEQYDILHVQMPYSPSLAGRIIKYAPERTVIMGTFHILPYGVFNTIANKALGILQAHSLRRFNTICFVSSWAMEFAGQAYNLKGPVIPNMINLNKWKNDIAIKPGRLVFLGRLVPRKGCRELLLAIAALPVSVRNDLEIIIAGDGPERRKLESLVKRLGLNVTFYGYIAELDKKGLLASAQFAIFPSLGGESFGIVLLEAMAAGAGIVIGGANSGYGSVLGEVPECLIDFRPTKEAAKKLVDIIQDVRKSSDLHTKQQHLITAYDVNHVGHKIEKMYASAIAKQTKRRDNDTHDYK